MSEISGLALQSQYGSFDAFLWQFVGGQPRQNAWQTIQDVPANVTLLQTGQVGILGRESERHRAIGGCRSRDAG